LDVLGSEYNVKSLLSNTIQDFDDMKENEKIISIDDVIIKNNLEFIGFINKHIDGDLAEFFNENTKIHMKMKINLREYLIMTNVLYPTLVK
jgi:hypothetical protein